MPGLALNGALRHRVDVNSTVQGDLGGDTHGGGRITGQLPALFVPTTGPMPILCNRPRTHWLGYHPPSPWMRMRDERPHWLLSSSRYGGGSGESEPDLQAMIVDFMENDSGEVWDSDSENGASQLAKICDMLEVLTMCTESPEREILEKVSQIVLETQEADLVHTSAGAASECRGNCLRRFILGRLIAAGYNAALCNTSWNHCKRVPASGDYEFIEVNLEGLKPKRLIVDVKFRTQFELARSTEQYLSVLHAIPSIFVGSAVNLEQVLDIMSEAMKCALKQLGMFLPPWRTVAYMRQKWFCPSAVRHTDPNYVSAVPPVLCSFHWRQSQMPAPPAPIPKPCGEQLRRFKVSLLAEVLASPISTGGAGTGGGGTTAAAPTTSTATTTVPSFVRSLR